MKHYHSEHHRVNVEIWIMMQHLKMLSVVKRIRINYNNTASHILSEKEILL
jgi:hypothetical protein